MKHWRSPGLLALALILATLQSACRKTYETDGTAPHETEVAFPVFSTEIRVSELIPNLLSDTLTGDTLIFNTDGSMTLSYAGTLAEKRILDVFKFGDTTLIVPLYDTVTVYDDTNLPDSLAIRRAKIKSGATRLIVGKGAAEPTTGRFRVLEMSKNGVAFEHYFSVPANGNYVSPELDLAGYDLVSNQNRLTYVYEAYTPSGQRVKYPDVVPGLPSVLAQSIQINYSYLEGYWGYEEYPLDKSRIELDVNKLELQGDIRIVDPRITFTVENSFGFPTSGKVKYLRFEGRDGIKRDLESSYIGPDGAVAYNYPSLAAGQVGQFVPTVFTFDRSNSNIADIFNSQPVAVEYEVIGVSNIEKDNTIIGFMTDSSSVRFKVLVELPLEGSAKNFGATRQVDVDLGDLDNLDDTDFTTAELKLVAENSLPLEAVAQVRFLDGAGAVLDSLFTGGLGIVMNAAPVDAQGIVLAPSRTENFIQLTAERVRQLKLAQKADIRTFFTTSGGGTKPVKLLADQSAIVKMGMKVRLE